MAGKPTKEEVAAAVELARALRILGVGHQRTRTKSSSAVCPDCDRCFYCRCELDRHHDHDHFPFPARFGGEHVVATCRGCHTLKDRTRLDQWSTEVALGAMAELHGAGTFTRMLVAALFTEAAHWHSVATREE